MEGDDEQALGFGEFAELAGLVTGGGEGLVDDDVLAGFEHALGEDEVGLIGRGDDDELDGFVGEDLVERAGDAGGWIGPGGGVSGALHDGDELSPGTALTNGA